MSETAPSIPYQAYKVREFLRPYALADFPQSKRHSHTPSNPQARFGANVVPAPTSRPSSVVSPTTPPPQTSPTGYGSWEKETALSFAKSTESPPTPVIVLDPSPPVSNGLPSPPASPGLAPPLEPPINQSTDALPEPVRVNGVHANGNGDANGRAASNSEQRSPTRIPVNLPSSSVASSSAAPEDPAARPRKTSTFRRVPRNARAPLPSSPLAGGHSRTASSSSMASSSLRPSLPPSEYPSYTQQRPTSMLVDPRERIQSLSSSPSTSERPPAISSISEDAGPPNRRHSTPLNAQAVAASLTSIIPPVRTSSLAVQNATPPSTAPMSRTPSSIPSRQTTPAPAPTSLPPSPSTLQPPTPPRQTSAPYRPGFQPKGVYRPRTDEFIAHRKAHAVSAGYASAERTKLERRLEKLVALHFPEEGKTTTGVGRRPGIAPAANANRRASSFFELDFKSILGGGGGKEDIRSAEQRITPWQDDSDASKCPLCTTNFHPLTNRKHHCRLCGQIICALPIKRPQRPQVCSLLFVVDPKTRNIEEVGEGVDYGVRKRRTSSVGGAKELQEEAAEEEKFLRGVRICSQCRPVLLRQQYHQQGMHVPPFVKLYEAFIILEKEIEDSLPQFQELILTLNHDSQPTKEASAARKRLLEAFAQYDSLAKRIRNLPTTNGPGSSQERVQIAVMTRANLFLQKNMFPLQSLPTPKHASAPAARSAVEDGDDASFIDPSSATAIALQPLLEQEALLETFIEEAKAQRKFEDAKTLRINLGELREEIERVLAAEGLKGKRARKGR
ncbi:FYVE zinc finger-domain-containing protein [Mycena latifolia]|nr:FYVE zinc finger-domain-containing protein [Mycena latifolia]